MTSHETESCLFCKIAGKKIPSAIVYEDDNFLAFKDIAPRAPTHILFIPKRHVPSLADWPAEASEELGKLFHTAATFARSQNLGDFRMTVNSGPGAGQSVFHLHVHVMAGRPFSWPPG